MENLLEKFWFRLTIVGIASVFITELGSMESLFQRLRTYDFYKEYLATLFISVTAVEFIYRINVRLNKKVPWHNQIISRLILQLVFGLLVPLLVVFALATLYFAIYNVNILDTDYLLYGFPLIAVLLITLNLILTMLPYFLAGIRQVQKKEVTAVSTVQQDVEGSLPEQHPAPTIKAHEGNSVVMLTPEQVTAAYIIEGKVVVKERDGKELLTDQTLDDLEKVFATTDFFRINRQLIASRNTCIAYKPLDHGKLEVELSIPVPVNTVVSQLKARAFKEWLELRN